MKIRTTLQNIQNYKTYLRMVGSIETFLKQKGFLKLDLPVLSPSLIPEWCLDIFETKFRYFNIKQSLYLTPSPELFIKRLISSGIGDCYCLGKSFRNSELFSSYHNPEFTMIEIYKIGENYKYMAGVVLEMLNAICQDLFNTNYVTYLGKKISFSRWEEISVAEAFLKYAAIEPVVLFDENKFIKKAKDKGYAIEGATYADLWSQIYANEVEKNLGTHGYPTLLYDYPVQFASLSKPNPDNKTAQRFEFYICGVELGNCASELTDHKLQLERFYADSLERKKSGKIEHSIDFGFIDMLKKGLPECTGIAIGVERLGMIFANTNSIDKLKLLSIN